VRGLSRISTEPGVSIVWPVRLRTNHPNALA
jgi:hypothetical protein